MTGKTDNIHPDLLELIHQLEQRLGYELTITSGKRDPAHNEKVGGVKGSEHTYPLSEGVDVACASSAKRYALIKLLYEMGVRRIGDGKTFVHIGIAKDKPQDVLWSYYP